MMLHGQLCLIMCHFRPSVQTDNLSVARFYTGKFDSETIRRTKIELA